MALDKNKLSNDLFKAETAGITMTPAAKSGVEKKCKAIADAIDKYVKSMTVTSQIQPQSIDTIGSPSAQKGPVVSVEITSKKGGIE